MSGTAAPALSGAAVPTGRLPVDPDALAACVACGLCLAHCPTYRVTGEEVRSPRGRIAAMREVDAGGEIDGAFVEAMETCVQCRACETACPSSVPFGRLMEGTRSVLAAQGRTVAWWQRRAYGVLGHHRLLVALTTVGAVAQRARAMPAPLARRLALPRLPLRQARLEGTGTDAWLFTGCVMDAWQRRTHRAVLAVAEAAGAGVALPGRGASCCGALHVHAGLTGDARRLARKVMGAFPGTAPVLVDSAGCGAALQDYGHLLGSAEGARFSARVHDVHEWLADLADRLPPPRRSRVRVVVQDPCHLRHVQQAESFVRTVLAPYAEVVELDDEGRCCGAGGAFSALQPALARAIRTQKVAAVNRAAGPGPVVVASANPGCSIWLAGAGLDVRHPVEIVATAAGLEGWGARGGR